jgi:hypothetical protein
MNHSDLALTNSADFLHKIKRSQPENKYTRTLNSTSAIPITRSSVNVELQVISMFHRRNPGGPGIRYFQNTSFSICSHQWARHRFSLERECWLQISKASSMSSFSKICGSWCSNRLNFQKLVSLSHHTELKNQCCSTQNGIPDWCLHSIIPCAPTHYDDDIQQRTTKPTSALLCSVHRSLKDLHKCDILTYSHMVEFSPTIAADSCVWNLCCNASISTLLRSHLALDYNGGDSNRSHVPSRNDQQNLKVHFYG